MTDLTQSLRELAGKMPEKFKVGKPDELFESVFDPDHENRAVPQPDLFVWGEDRVIDLKDADRLSSDEMDEIATILGAQCWVEPRICGNETKWIGRYTLPNEEGTWDTLIQKTKKEAHQAALIRVIKEAR